MIQRIQSLYLSLTILMTLLFLKGSFLTFIDKSGSVTKVTFTGLIRDTGDTGVKGLESVHFIWLLTAIIILIPVISLVTIFLFKNRKIQIRFALSGIILSAGLILVSLYYIYTISSTFGTQITAGYKMFIPILLLIFNYLAYRGIRKDELLVKSYDRLR